MKCRTAERPVTYPFSSCDAFTCPSQILVIDHPNGPANVLVDTISLLMDREVSVTSVESHTDAVRALDYYHFDLIVVGLREQQPLQLTILPRIQAEHPDHPILVIGRKLPRLYQQYARNFGSCEVLNIPERAAELKALVARMTNRYLNGAGVWGQM